MIKCIGLRVANTAVLRASPVLSQQKFIKIERPPNMNGSYGRTVDGVQKPGLVDILRECYLDNFVTSIKAGLKPKKAILFFKKEEDIADVNDFLCDVLPEVSASPSSCPRW